MHSPSTEGGFNNGLPPDYPPPPSSHHHGQQLPHHHHNHPESESAAAAGNNTASSHMYRQLKDRRDSRYQQYSSQDSLPDSPYSSQSLDSQSAQGQDRLRRSMPNLNKIRGRGGSANVGGRGPAAVNAGINNQGHGGGTGLQRPSTYGLSRQHNSDPRLQAAVAASSNQTSRIGGRGGGYYGGRPSYAGPPSRGSMVSNESEMVNPPSRDVSRDSTFRVPTQPSQQPQPKLSLGSRLARPVGGSGIPRPGSRLPGPTGRTGIPKPSSSGSQPGSRASSVGPRRRPPPNAAATDYNYY